ncbi:MAG: GlsB/YeaQ/YmgE family stress response membrane protein [Sphingomonadales bacterium]|nr:GlsB/YeaQ/YmgE family stress response membrane protein [Sphingomonadales bacterium]MBD3774035.1 GlsB/YeaQ/YmgE family stress response membrane protein [Paracoccaceae bacterium]
MGLIITLIVGGIAGWLASMVMARDASMGIILNIIVGIIGAFLGNWLIAPLIGFGGDISSFNLPGLIIAVLGAIVLLAIANLIQRGRLR